MPENLWSFACRLYAQPDVAASCLIWQEQFGADVNLLLMGFWLADQGRCWSVVEASELQTWVADWRSSAVLPLRAARAALAGSDLYEVLKMVELDAERVQLTMLDNWLRQRPIADRDDSATSARHNLQVYACMLPVPVEPIAIEALLACCSPGRRPPSR